MHSRIHAIALFAIVLSGCASGPERLTLAPDDTIVLVDVLPREAFAIGWEGPLGVVPAVARFDQDWGVSDAIVNETARWLRANGHRVEVVRPPLVGNDSPIPYNAPVGFHYPMWTPAFRQWTGTLLEQHHARVAIFLGTYARELLHHGPPYYGAYGIKAQKGPLAGAPVFYSMVNTVRISRSDLALSYFVTVHPGATCEAPLPQELVEKLSKNTIGAADLAHEAATLEQLGLRHVRNDLVAAGFISGAIEQCSGE